MSAKKQTNYTYCETQTHCQSNFPLIFELYSLRCWFIRFCFSGKNSLANEKSKKFFSHKYSPKKKKQNYYARVSNKFNQNWSKQNRTEKNRFNGKLFLSAHNFIVQLNFYVHFFMYLNLISLTFSIMSAMESIKLFVLEIFFLFFFFFSFLSLSCASVRSFISCVT